MDIRIQPLTRDDRHWVTRFAADQWGTDTMVVHGTSYRLSELPGFSALHEDTPVGLITYRIAGDDCEIVSLDSLREGQGIGSALLSAVTDVAAARHCRRLWLVTTNDNLHALGFYQRRGFVLVALHRDAVSAARRIKPEIPLVGRNGVPIRDEIELESPLG